MKLRQYVLTGLEVRKLKLLEFIRFDSKTASFVLFLFYLANYYFLQISRRHFYSLLIAGKIFRHIQFDWCRNFASAILRKYINKYGSMRVADNIFSMCEIDQNKARKLKESLVKDDRPFDKRLIILSEPKFGEKGVMLVKFTYNFKYLRSIFDLDKLSSDYVLVLEPSSCGYFDEDILCLLGQKNPMIVQTPEPVDQIFLSGLNACFVPVELGANCWVDKRTFYPIRDIEKKYDLIMIAFWGDVKRHYHLFEALSKARNKEKIKVALIGVPWPKTVEEIKNIANYFKVNDCVEYFEKISQNEINMILNKSRIYLLLSKKEGFNKSLIEALHANVPGFLLYGYNYGYQYPYMNSKTGGFISRSGLTEFIENIDNLLINGHFSPYEWVSKYMSAESSTVKLVEVLKLLEKEKDIRINKNLELKINNPDCDYFEQTNWSRYSGYYKNLKVYFK